MSKKPIRVFLSGTRLDLEPYWGVAADAVRSVEGFQPSSMDGGTAAPIPIDQWSRREATIPDLYVALIGRCYGQLLSGQDLSLTEQEYDTAAQVGLDRLVFLTEDSDPARLAEEGSPKHEAVERFREKARRDVVFDRVDSPSDFKSRLVLALQGWERRTLRGAVESAESHYSPWLDGSSDFGHQDDFVAREAQLVAIRSFTGSSQRVLVLEAAWGQGKSRLLLELARTQGGSVRFIREDALLTRESLDISAVDPCIVVLEDVQKRPAEERRRLLTFLKRFGPDVKLIVSSRPSHAEDLLADIRQLGYSAAEFTHVTLEPFPDPEHQQLVAKILGSDDEEAHIIAQRTRGNVLAGVVTARMFKRGAVTLGQIEASDEFRHSVLRTFEAALLEHAKAGVDQRYAEALRAVAVAGPLKTDDDEVIAALADFLGWKAHVVRRTLADLVDGDLLVRRGDLARVPVDALADSIRRQACVSSDKTSLGFAEYALERLWPALGGSLLRNLAELSWELQQEGAQLDFLREFWPRITATYDSAPASTRMRILEHLEEAAPYAPAAVVAFVRHVLPSGLGPEEQEEMLRGHYKLHWIHDRISKLLQGALYHAEHVEAACDFLWHLAENDLRDPRHNTSSAERILQDAAKYRLRTELPRYAAILRWTRRRHQAPAAIPGARLAKYVRPLLDRELQHDWSDGRAMHMSARGLSAAAIGTLRRETLEFLELLALEEDRPAIAAALDGIGQTLATPPGAFGRTPTPQEIAQWHPEELASLARIQRVRATHNARSVDLCVMSEIAWVAQHSEHVALREQAAAMMVSIREGLAGSLELALSHDYQLYWDAEDSRAEQHQRDVAQIAADYSAVETRTTLEQIREAYTALDALGRNPDPTAVLFNLAKLNADHGEALVTEVLAEPDGPLLASLGGLLGGLAECDVARTQRIAESIMRSGVVKAKRILAGTYKFQRFIEQLGPTLAIAHLETLLRDADAMVREGALSALSFRDNLPSAERIRLLLAYELAECPVTGEEWAQAVHGAKVIEQTSPEEHRSIAATLGHAARLGFWACDLIEDLAPRVPDQLVEMLVARVPHARDDDFAAAIDRSQKDPLALLPEAARERGMTALGAYMGNPDFKISHAATDLFGKLATGDPALMRRVRLSWIRSGDQIQVLKAAESLNYEESEFLLEEEGLVVALLEAAEAQGADFLRTVESELFAVSSRGIRSGTPGEDATRDIALRDGALGIASRHAQGSTSRRFYEDVARHTQSKMDFLRRRDE